MHTYIHTYIHTYWSIMIIKACENNCEFDHSIYDNWGDLRLVSYASPSHGRSDIASYKLNAICFILIQL